MHRFDGVGYVEVGGKRRFKNRELPTYIGSKPDDEIMNAIQEEIAGVIEGAGLTLRASGAADETAEWGQLAQAIFNAQAINTAALTDGAVTVDKIGALAVTNAKINDMAPSKLQDGDIVMTSSRVIQVGDSGPNGYARLDSIGINALADNSGTTYQLETSITPRGLLMPVGTGGPGAHNVQLRFSEFNFTPSGLSISNRVIDFTFTTPLTLGGIPDQTRVKSTFIDFSTDSEGYDRHTLPLSCTWAQEDSGAYSDVTFTSASALATAGLAALANIYNARLIVGYDPSYVD